MRKRFCCGLAALFALAATPSHAACKVGKLAELPVTMTPEGPMVDVKLNGEPTRLIADSGAFFSILSPGAAQTFHLPLTPAPDGFYLRAVNGSVSVHIATVKTFTLGRLDVPRVPFLVGGSETGGSGVIGQNVFGVGDVEYDLPHGAIRLLKSEGCDQANLAYWSVGRSFSVVKIEPRSPQNPHTIGTIQINGKPIRATFDTGAGRSILSLAAAARLGIKPDSPGVVDGGMTYGFGRRLARTWIAPVQSFSVGDGEQIKNARVRFGEIDLDTDMLIGADFFIAHRVYVDNSHRRLFLSYEGGPVFNLKARREGPEEAEAAPEAAAGAAAPAAPTVSADGESRDGAVAMARNDVDGAVARFTKAIALAPTEPRYLTQRAQAYLRLGKEDLARADLDEAIRLQPGDAEALLTRAVLLLRKHDWSAATADLDATDRSIDAAAMERLELGALMAEAGEPRRAVGVLGQWIKAHPDDVRRPAALNARCWAYGLAGQDLDAALRDCDTALREMPGGTDILDSRGLVELRRGDLPKSIADYSAALAKQPHMAWSLYGRGIAKLRSNDKDGGLADIQAAKAAQADIAEVAKRYGIAP